MMEESLDFQTIQMHFAEPKKSRIMTVYAKKKVVTKKDGLVPWALELAMLMLQADLAQNIIGIQRGQRFTPIDIHNVLERIHGCAYDWSSHQPMYYGVSHTVQRSEEWMLGCVMRHFGIRGQYDLVNALYEIIAFFGGGIMMGGQIVVYNQEIRRQIKR